MPGNNTDVFQDVTGGNAGGTWYFYNRTAVAAGITQFRARWGNRPLEDHWRRKQKEAIATFEEYEIIEENEIETTPEELDDNFDPVAEVAQLRGTIPFTQEEQTAALTEIEEALFKLGNIYNFQLEEPDNAIDTFEKLLARFPGSEHEPEALYLLFLIHKKREDANKADFYKDKLTSAYPETIFANLAINPNYLQESAETNERLQKLYEIAYQYYEDGKLDQAGLLVSRALQQYPDNSFSDKLKILGILIDGKVEGKYKYQYELQEFVENNPESEVVEYAKKLLAASREFEVNEAQRSGARFISDFDQPHFLVVVFAESDSASQVLPAVVDRFLENKYPALQLKTGTLSLNDRQSLVLVNKFQDKELAMQAYDVMAGEGGPLGQLARSGAKPFVITEDNFQIFFQTKRLDDYLAFFDTHYINNESNKP
jgi:outer membrane protein assembly factor BamD (BamD/ComL family)